jgi:hypothetical protein
VVFVLDEGSEHRLPKHFVYVPTAEFLEAWVDKVCLGRIIANF